MSSNVKAVVAVVFVVSLIVIANLVSKYEEANCDCVDHDRYGDCIYVCK